MMSETDSEHAIEGNKCIFRYLVIWLVLEMPVFSNTASSVITTEPINNIREQGMLKIPLHKVQ